MLTLAVLCHVYDPHEYRVRSLRDGATSNLFYFGQHSPGWSGRISKGLNFPVVVLVYPFRDATQPLYVKGDIDHLLVYITGADLAFFFGVLFFWSCMGWAIDRRELPVPKSVNVSGLVGGLVFGLVAGGYAATMIISKWLPERIIGSFGVTWAALLISYFVWRLGLLGRFAPEA
jgi:hypothetical protein